MKKLSLFLAIIAVSFSSFAKDPCPTEKTSQNKAICLRDVAIGAKSNPYGGDYAADRAEALKMLKEIFQKEPALEQKLSKWWLSLVMEAMKDKETDNKLEFYLGKGATSLGLNPNFIYKYTNTLNGMLYNEDQDYLIHAVIRTINEYESKDFIAAKDGVAALIKYADVCVKDKGGSKPADLFKERTKGNDEIIATTKINGAFIRRLKAQNNCQNPTAKK